MRFIFSLFNYFPYGGLERNFLGIAEQCVLRGHRVSVFTRQWEGDKPAFIEITQLPVTALTNHGRDRQFVDQFYHRLSDQQFDVIVGFNKMPGLDVYYAADPCYATITASKPWFYRATPRYKHYLAYESAVFGSDQGARIMAVSTAQIPNFKRFYKTPDTRFLELPPGINPNRKAPHNREEIRQQWRNEFNIADDDLVILAVGADFKRKGLERTIKAIAALPEAVQGKVKLFAVGDVRSQSYMRLSKQLNFRHQPRFFTGRDDIPRFLMGADCLAHPAYVENTGNVLLEAIIAGLPVIATEQCGYAFHIQKAQAGLVIKEPFDQRCYNRLLLEMMTSKQRASWQINGISYGECETLYQRAKVAADIIEATALSKKKPIT